jgi:hypothetical protein
MLIGLLSDASLAGDTVAGFCWDWQESTYDTYNKAKLGGTWIVQPNGLGATGDPNASQLNWLFFTTTNSKWGSPEVLNVYTPMSDAADLNIYAWSCSVSDPCDLATGGPGTITTDGWVYVRSMKSLPQYVYNVIDDGGHPQKAISFRIETVEVGGPVPNGDPARWSVTVSLWNHQSGTWDDVWDHQYDHIKIDCHQATNQCGTGGGDKNCDWLASMEELRNPDVCTTLPCTLPKMREIGVQNLTFEDDSGPVAVTSPSVGWSPPVTAGGTPGGCGTGTAKYTAPWQAEHRTDNHSYGMGNFFNVDPLEACP